MAQQIKESRETPCWNIQHGGGTRLARIVEEISAYDPDVIAVSEFRVRPGVALCAAMRERGLVHVETTQRAENQNGIGVFSRTPMGRTRHCPAPSAGLLRWLDIDLPEYGFGIGVLHVMAAGSSNKHPTNVAKTRFWEVVLQSAESRLQEPFLFVGDRNTGAHRLDETGKTFECAEQTASVMHHHRSYASLAQAGMQSPDHRTGHQLSARIKPPLARQQKMLYALVPSADTNS